MSGIVKEVHKSLEYILEENRRKTFKKWVFKSSDICSADRMAEAGFIFIGNKIDVDSVKCFLCHKCLDGWEATDDPWLEHIKHSPNCTFAKLKKRVDDMTVRDFLNVKNVLIESIITSHYENYQKEVENRIENIIKVLSKMTRK